MISRCYNPKDKEFARYGGSGIAICDRWLHSFENFYEDMGDPPTVKHTLDRYPDQRGNYEPGNVRWATIKEQMNNLTTNRKLTVKGETLNFCQWVERAGLPRSTIYNRLMKGWSEEDAIFTPSRGRPRPRGFKRPNVDYRNLNPHPRTKITDALLLLIRDMVDSGISQKEIARRYEVRPQTISKRLLRLKNDPPKRRWEE
jgi:hypothetical protein